MLRIEYTQPTEAWLPDFDTVHSFLGAYRACRIHGPARLIRLVTFGGDQAPEGQKFRSNRIDGSFWFDAADFDLLRKAAKADLSGQGAQARLRDTLSMYLRFQLRNLLAVRRDWTPSFDAYVELSVPLGTTVTALVGLVKAQPVYSESFTDQSKASSAGLALEGGLTQYVINFELPANRASRKFIGAVSSF